VADFIMRLSPVETGDLAVARIVFKNTSGQSYNQVTVTLGDSVPGGVGSPPGPSLPADASIVGISGPNAGDCVWAAHELTCVYGHVAKGGTRQVSVVLNPGASNPFSAWAEAQINETQGTTNTDSYFAPTTATPFAEDFDNKAAVVDAGQLLKLSTSSGANGYGVSVAMSKVSDGTDAVAIRENQSDVFIPCPAGVSCLTDTIQLFANFGDTLNPEVTVAFDDKSTKISGVFKLNDDGTPPIDIPNDKAHTCSAKVPTYCFISVKAGTAIMKFPSNGGIRVH
jgi:hypothetical protein